MTEIKITKLIALGGFADFSASRAELGDNAAADTWNAAADEAKAHRIMTPAQREAFRDYMRGCGAWDDVEIDGWKAYECDALLIQTVAGDMRELESLAPGDGVAGINWEEAERLAERGTVQSRVYCSGSDVFIYIGS